MKTVKVKLSALVDAVTAVATYLTDYSRLVVLRTVAPPIFTALPLQVGEEDVWT